MAAIIRYTKTHILVLCSLGHLLEAHKSDRDFGGSWIEAELGFRYEGDRLDRLAANCKGYGHGVGEELEEAKKNTYSQKTLGEIR